MLYHRVEASQGDEIAEGPGRAPESLRQQLDEITGDPTRVLETLRKQTDGRREDDAHLFKKLLLRLRWVLNGPFMAAQMRRLSNDAGTFCQRCGQHSMRGRTITYHWGSDNALKRLLSRLRRVLPERRPPFEDAGGRIDIPRLLISVEFPVYGLKGTPLGMRLGGLGWGGGGNGHAVGRVILGYAERETREPRRAIELDQGPGTIRQSSEGRLSSELHAIMSVVPSHSSGALRQEYLRKGNIHRDWNLERIRGTQRRWLTIGMNKAPVEVELAYWWEPELVVLARMMPEGHSILATSVGITHVELLSALKTMAVLQRDPGALDKHQREYEESY